MSNSCSSILLIFKLLLDFSVINVISTLFIIHLCSIFNYIRYAYSDEVGEEYDEETQSLTRGKSEGDLNLVKQEKKETDIGNTDVFDEDDTEEDKRE